jgi:hypothetical protein
MIIATIIASLIIVVMVIIAVVTNSIEAKKKAAVQGEEKQLICEGKVCNDIVTFDSQEDMIRYILECYNCEWVQKM